MCNYLTYHGAYASSVFAPSEFWGGLPMKSQQQTNKSQGQLIPKSVKNTIYFREYRMKYKTSLCFCQNKASFQCLYNHYHNVMVLFTLREHAVELYLAKKTIHCKYNWCNYLSISKPTTFNQLTLLAFIFFLVGAWIINQIINN